MALVYITTPLDLTGIHSWHCISYFFLMMKKIRCENGGNGQIPITILRLLGGGGGGGGGGGSLILFCKFLPIPVLPKYRKMTLSNNKA